MKANRMSDLHFVESFDDETVTLKHVSSAFITHRATVKLAEIASVDSTLIELRVRTTGGANYRVTRGFTKAVRRRTSEAFIGWGK